MNREEQLALFDRWMERAYARCLQDFKRRRGEILARVADSLWSDDEEYAQLHEQELAAAAAMVSARIAKMRRGWM